MFGTYRMDAGWTRVRFALVAALPLFLTLPIAANARAVEEAAGPGTDFVKCTDGAWKDYNNCLMNADHAWEPKLCDIAFQADIAWCSSVYWQRLKTGT